MQHILIVDDIPENLYFLEVLLKGNGFEVYPAENGVEALRIARCTPPDLVVSDILMPVMDGYTLCREWRTDEQLKEIPFIFYTATFTEKKDESLALSLGADGFIVKPQEPDTLIGIIRQALSSSCENSSRQSVAADFNDGGILREYNEALFRKLEKKMADLEKANRELEQYMAEQKRLEEQLRHAQKMEAIGRFSAGIAHDFNNILTVIIGFGSIMRTDLENHQPLLGKLDHILAAADRAKHLTASLLTFSRKQEMKLHPIDLNATIVRVDTFLHRVIGKDIELRTSLKNGCIPVYADAGHLEQILMNLAINSRDAMPDGGVFTIATDIVTHDGQHIQSHGVGNPGQHALLTVSDTGTGMDDTTRLQVFEPFFTTKQSGHGTGLGLSIVYGIVQQHGGSIKIDSQPGQGTTFSILLPLITEQVFLNEATHDHQPARGGNETILAVDDEASVRECLQIYLEGLGYRVICAEDGASALAHFSNRSNEIDLVLMDVILPHKSARETADEMKSIRNDIKILFSSGYSSDLIHERNLLDQQEELVMKPLNPHELARRVREILDRKVTADKAGRVGQYQR